jgi:hypothetical protein
MHAEAWLSLHLPQLEHYRVPPQLHRQVFDCVHDNEGDWSDLDAVAATKPASEDSRSGASHRKMRVEAAMPLPAEDTVLRIAHEWEFQSVLDAQTQLRQDEALRTKMKTMIDEVIHEREHELEIEEESDQGRQVEHVVRHLHLLAFSIRFGAESDEMAYYVLNALGSR